MPVVTTPNKKQTLDPVAYATSKKNREKKKEIQVSFNKITSEIGTRAATAEEKQKMDKMFADILVYDENIERAEQILIDVPDDDDARVKEAEERAAHAERLLAQKGLPAASLPGTEKRKLKLDRYGETDEEYAIRERRSGEDYVNLAKHYLRGGKSAIEQALQVATKDQKRALQADVDYKGGYLVMPEQMSNKILKATDNLIQVKKWATVTKLMNAQSMGIPSLDADPADSDWTTEIATVQQDTAMSFGKRVLMPMPFRKLLKVSERWLRMASQAYFDSVDDANGEGGSPGNLVTNRLAYKNAITAEKAYHTGNGVGRPLGLYTASNRGITTARDVAVFAAGALTYSLLVTAKWTLKVQYQKTAKWEFSRGMIQRLMQLVDTAGRPILNFSTIPNTPTTLLEHEILLSEYVPNTFSGSAYVGMLGDFSFYHIADTLEFWIKMAEELYLEQMQVGFFTSAETDGMPVLEEAFVRLQYA